MRADETVLQVLNEQDRKATDESRVWVYASAKRAAHQVRLFRYEGCRAGACAEEMLKGFQGILVADGYSGYNLVSRQVIRAGCWAHMRRKWVEAMPKGAAAKNSKAAIGYEYCNRLFEIERELESVPGEERRQQRQLRSKAVVDEYYAWLDTIFQPSGKQKQAVTCAVNQKEYLCTFLDHGEILIRNSQIENTICPLVEGRKNWLFPDAPGGAEASAVVYSLIETANANGLNVEQYLLHISILPQRFADDP